VTLKELLGHADITTTMIYLHVAQCPLIKPHSPLDTLYHYPKHVDKVQQAYSTPWVVNCEPSLARAEHAVQYLGHYTHRVAITNQRIVNIAGGKVTFMAKDYRDRAVKKPVTLDGVEFLRRFTLHILPTRFVKIRYYGIYNHTTKSHLELQFIPEEKPDLETLINREKLPNTGLQRFEQLTGINPCLCPVCKTGKMVRVRELPRIRAPAGVFSSLCSEQSL